jgi:hypothetical protein
MKYNNFIKINESTVININNIIYIQLVKIENLTNMIFIETINTHQFRIYEKDENYYNLKSLFELN